MARFIFDTNDPQDIELMHKLVAAGLITPPEEHDLDFDLTEAVDALLSSVGKPTQGLIAQFVIETAVEGVTTLDTVAKARGMSTSDAKSKKMNFGRTVKKVRKQFPGLPEPIQGRFDATDNCTKYTMDPDVREVMDVWLSKHGLIKEVIDEPVAPTSGAA